jgi:hypothetical protein
LAIGSTYGSFEEIQAQLRAIWRVQHPSAIGPRTDEEIDRALGRNEMYVCLPGRINDDVILKLGETYPKVGFIVHHTHDDVPSAFPPSAPPVRPALTRDEEIKIADDYDDATLSLSRGTG